MPRNSTTIALLGLFFVTFLARLSQLSATPRALGIDGYYYAVQLRSLAETGHLYYPAAPLVFWLASPLTRLVGAIQAAKVMGAFGTSAMVFPAYLWARRAGAERLLAWVGAIFVSVSPSSFFLATEFVKECLGLAFAAAFLAVIWKAPSRGVEYALAAALLIAALLSHKSAFGLACSIAAFRVAWQIPEVVRNGVRSRARAAWLFLASVGLALATALASIMPQRFLGFADSGLVTGMFQSVPDLSLATLRTPGSTLFFNHEPALVLSLALTYLVTQACRRASVPPLAWGLCAYAVLIGCPWLDVTDPDGLAFRLRLTAFAIVPPLLALAATPLLGHLAARTRTLLSSGVCVGLLATNSFARTLDASNGVVIAPEPLLVAMERLSDVVPARTLVVTPYRQLAFMATWFARVRAPLKLPENAERERSYHLLRGPLPPELVAALDEARASSSADAPIDLHPGLKDEVVLVQGRCFESLLSRVSPELRARLEQ